MTCSDTTSSVRRRTSLSSSTVRCFATRLSSTASLSLAASELTSCITRAACSCDPRSDVLRRACSDAASSALRRVSPSSCSTLLSSSLNSMKSSVSFCMVCSRDSKIASIFSGSCSFITFLTSFIFRPAVDICFCDV